MIELLTLNGVVVLRDGEEVALQPKRLLLLAYLLLEGRTAPVRRDQLLALFWPDADDERARNALRQSLFALRTALGADVIGARGMAELAVDRSMVRCDALDLLAAVDAADHAQVNAIHRTEFLAAVHAGDSPELERWIDDTRARFRRLATMAVRALAAQPALPLEERRALLERLLMLAPYDEAVAMRLVGHLIEAGDRSAAVEQFRVFAARLRADLEIEPSQAFVQLVESARSGDGVPLELASGFGGAPGGAGAGAAVAVRRRRGAVLTVLAVAVSAAAFAVTMITKPDVRLIEVDAFRTPAGDSAAARVAVLAADHLRGSLASVPGFRVLGDARQRAPRLRLTPPGTRVQGGVERGADGRWVVWASVVAAESEMLLQRAEVQGAHPDSLLGALGERVGAVVATRRDMDLQWGTTLHSPQVLSAIQRFQSAFEAIGQGDAQEGIARFEQAWAMDSTFVFAGLLAATSAEAIGSYAQSDSLLERLAPFERTMLPLERRQFLRMRALKRSDLSGMLLESRAIVELEPRAPFLLSQLAQDAYVSNRPREALDALERLQRLRGANEGESGDLSIHATSLHLLGRFREELAIVDAALSRPDALPHLGAFRFPPLGALGQSDTLAVAIGAIAARGEQRDVGRLYLAAALELNAHGHREGGARLLASGLAWLGTHPVDSATTMARRISAAELLYHGRRFPESEALLTVPAVTGGTLTHGQRSAIYGLRGLLAARQGRTAEAQAWSDSLLVLGMRGRFGQETYRRARIAAVLGDAGGAIALLEQANQEGFVTHREVHIDPNLESLRSNTRFRMVTGPRG